MREKRLDKLKTLAKDESDFRPTYEAILKTTADIWFEDFSSNPEKYTYNWCNLVTKNAKIYKPLADKSLSSGLYLKYFIDKEKARQFGLSDMDRALFVNPAIYTDQQMCK